MELYWFTTFAKKSSRVGRVQLTRGCPAGHTDAYAVLYRAILPPPSHHDYAGFLVLGRFGG